MRLKFFALFGAGLLILSYDAMGQFLNLPQYANGTNLPRFVEADVNHDGKADIVGLRSPQQVTVLLGQATGGFGAPVNTPITGVDNIQLDQFLVRDFNGDGHPDVAFFGTDHVTGVNVVAVMLGNGDGTFQSPKTSPSPMPSGATFPEEDTVSAGDYNGDGKIDVALVSAGITVLLGKGDGTFSPPITNPVNIGQNGGIASMTSGDFNNDGKSDVVVDAAYSGLYVLLSKGDGTFQPSILASSWHGWPLVAEDLNGDGNLDLVVNAAVLLGDGTGHFPTVESLGGVGTHTAITIQDLNGDGHPDVAAVTIGLPGLVTVFLNNGDGSFATGRTYNADGVNTTVPGVGLATVDANGDGKPDLAFENSTGGISVLIGNGDGTFQGNLTLRAGGTDLRVGDFNGDHKPDLILSNQVLLGNGDGTFTVKGGGGCPANFSTVAIGDFNGDGISDIAGNTTSNGTFLVDVCLGNGDGTFRAGGQFDLGIQHKLVLPGDFNNDGKLDLAASDQHGISILLGNGDGTFQSGIPTALNATFPNFATGDFNNDGKLDIVVAAGPGIAVLLGKGDGTLSAPLISPGPKSGFPTVRDLNKDGKLDLVIANSGGITVLLGKGDGTFQAPLLTSLPATGRAVVADFNQDGNLDVAVAATGNVVDVLLGDGTGKLMPPKQFRAGGSVSGIVSSDFNGDRATDIAIVRQAGVVVTLLNQK